MVHVETVDLSARGVEFPSDRVGMVIVQPYLSLTVRSLISAPRKLSRCNYECSPIL
jgi:hypothetical protein